MSEEREEKAAPVDAIKRSKIEVYNNTTKEMVLKLDDYLNPDFKVHLKKGNHYTLMIRKNGFLTKRMEAFVDVKGCILCFEGIGEVRPGVADNLTAQNTFGTLLANVELERVYPGKEIAINTIYYAPGTHELSTLAKTELEKLKIFMTDNPDLIIELGSHTDARGNHKANQALSQKRADTAVEFILAESDIESSRLVAKGYGFTNILNHCKPGVKCTKEEHGVNRRTELKLIGVLNENGFVERSLASMKQIEHMDELLAEIQQEGTISIPDDAEIKKNSKLSKKEVIEINEEFEDESTEIRASVKETVEEIVGKKGRELDSFKPQLDDEENSIKEETSIDAVQELDVAEQVVDVQVVEEKKSIEVAQDQSEIVQEVSNSDEENWMSGHKIVLMESKEALPESHQIFKSFDNIKTLKSPISKNNMYIIGDFPSEILAKEYLEGKIRKEYPVAYLISF